MAGIAQGHCISADVRPCLTHTWHFWSKNVVIVATNRCLGSYFIQVALGLEETAKRTGQEAVIFP